MYFSKVFKNSTDTNSNSLVSPLNSLEQSISYLILNHRMVADLADEELVLKQYNYVSYIMRKPVFAICKQQRCRSACASMQSAPLLFTAYIVWYVYLLCMSKVSKLISIAEQVGLPG